MQPTCAPRCAVADTPARVAYVLGVRLAVVSVATLLTGRSTHVQWLDACAAAAAAAQVVQACPALRHLELSDTHPRETTACREVAPGGACAQLQALQGMAALAALRQLGSLQLDWRASLCPAGLQAVLQAVGALTQLRTLALRVRNQFVMPRDLAPLAPLQQLRELRVASDRTLLDCSRSMAAECGKRFGDDIKAALWHKAAAMLPATHVAIIRS